MNVLSLAISWAHKYFRVFSVGGGRIVEESSFSVPLTEDYESKIRAQIR